MVGYLDIVILDEFTNTLKIYDIKTSTMGWNKWMKKDENKTQQLLLYKQFYSKQYNHPIDKIEVEYFIVKRKLYENLDFPQKRVQKFSPASGTVSMNKVARRLDSFLDGAFTESGERKSNQIATPSSKNSCKSSFVQQAFSSCSFAILKFSIKLSLNISFKSSKSAFLALS